MMETLTFTCNIITPMFLAGADGKTPELRAASIKGALRFWWRAANGHLELDEMRKKEQEIFGGVGNEPANRSKVVLRVRGGETLSIRKGEGLVPHKPNMRADAFHTGQSFEVILTLQPGCPMTAEQLQALVEITFLLGGLGRRVRRGMGSIKPILLKNRKLSGKEESIPISEVNELNDVLQKLEVLNPGQFDIYRDQVESRFRKNEAYPWIKQIQIGRPSPQILSKISDTTHDLHQKEDYRYDQPLGNSSGGGRFASPVYVSVFEDDGHLRPIITQLNAVPKNRRDQPDLALQAQFMDQIL
jgi:CRISPR-associated protein Cmr1